MRERSCGALWILCPLRSVSHLHTLQNLVCEWSLIFNFSETVIITSEVAFSLALALVRESLTLLHLLILLSSTFPKLISSNWFNNIFFLDRNIFLSVNIVFKAENRSHMHYFHENVLSQIQIPLLHSCCSHNVHSLLV